MQVKYLRIWLLSLFSLALLPMALAAADFSVILSPFANWSYMDYERYQLVWDIIILMLFFGLITKQILEERLGKKAAPIIGIVLGVILALWLNKVGLSLMDMGPWVAGLGVIIFCALVFLLFEKLSGTDKKLRNIWIAMVVGQILITVVLNAGLDGDWSDNSAIGVIYSILTLANIIGAIWFVGKNFFNMFGGGSSTPPVPPVPPPPVPPPPPPVPPITDHDRLMNLISDYIAHVLSFDGNNIAPLRNLQTNVISTPGLIRNPAFITAVNSANIAGNAEIVAIMNKLIAIRRHVAFASLTPAEKTNLDAGVSRMTYYHTLFVNIYIDILGRI